MDPLDCEALVEKAEVLVWEGGGEGETEEVYAVVEGYDQAGGCAGDELSGDLVGDVLAASFEGAAVDVDEDGEEGFVLLFFVFGAVGVLVRGFDFTVTFESWCPDAERKAVFRCRTSFV